MNLIEAVKTGKWFRRASHPKKSFKFGTNPKEWTDFTKEEILADDYEIEPESILITREDFDAAWRRALDVTENMEIKNQHYLYELVVRELGL